MIDPSTIDPLSLPSVLLEQRSELPTTSGIYFAIDSQGIVQYIGLAKDLKQRWNTHHRYEYLKLCNEAKIAYLQVDDVEFLPEIEAALIRYFQPPINKLGSAWLNSAPSKPGLKVRRIIKQEIDVPKLGENIKKAREADGRSLTKLAALVGVSRNYWYQLEAESVMGGMSEETLRRIEEVLNIDLGVKFDD